MGIEARVWEAGSGRELLSLKGHSHLITSAAFSLDDRHVVTGSYDQTAKVWDAVNGQELLTLKGHSGFIHCVAFSLDDQRIATGSHDGTARIWDATSGKELFKLEGTVAAITAQHPSWGSGGAP